MTTSKDSVFRRTFGMVHPLPALHISTLPSTLPSSPPSSAPMSSPHTLLPSPLRTPFPLPLTLSPPRCFLPYPSLNAPFHVPSSTDCSNPLPNRLPSQSSILHPPFPIAAVSTSKAISMLRSNTVVVLYGRSTVSPLTIPGDQNAIAFTSHLGRLLVSPPFTPRSPSPLASQLSVSHRPGIPLEQRQSWRKDHVRLRGRT